MKDTNIVYTKGFVNDDGCIEIPGVFLEDGAKVELSEKDWTCKTFCDMV